MIRVLPLTIAERLDFYHQDHLLAGWDSLPVEQQAAFSAQLEAIDFEQLANVLDQHRSSQAAGAETPAQRALRARPPATLIRQPQSSADEFRWKAAAVRGEQLLRSGKVGAILVAGGQGTRLGYDYPKGMFPLGPVSEASLFQMLCEQLLARSRRAECSIPYYVMTSDATHAETVAYFKQNQNFGLPAGEVQFFSQGNMPALDAHTGQLLLSEPGQLALSPDGHGGLLAALQAAKLLEAMEERGVEYLYYHQVDNPLAIVCDPAYLGWHVETESEMSTKVVAKTSAEDKMGVAVDVDGVTQIIEYSDLPKEVAERRTAAGELEIWAGSTAIHIFNREFLQRLVTGPWELPFHIAHKAVPHHVPGQGIVSPSEPNAYKFERFIFDIMPQARKALIVEANRVREFNPLKNADGVHSPDDVRRSLVRMHRNWVRQAGQAVPEDTDVEISPLVALDAEELTAKIDQVTPRETKRGLLWAE